MIRYELPCTKSSGVKNSPQKTDPKYTTKENSNMYGYALVTWNIYVLGEANWCIKFFITVIMVQLNQIIILNEL